MTNRSGDTQLRETAQVALSGAMTDLLAESEADLSWLPDDFAERLLEIAWTHQFDVDKTRFRRAVKKYLTEIAEVEAQ